MQLARLLLFLGLVCACILNVAGKKDKKHRHFDRADNRSISSRCGSYRRRSNSRITIGYQANLGEFPSYVHVFIWNDRNGYRCGGVIISEWLVLTAAHCILPIVTSGEIFVGSIARSGGRKLEVAQTCQPPGWINNSATNHISDIGILVMERPIEFDQNVQPACLPSIKIDASYQAHMVGLGLSSLNPKVIPDHLQVLPVRKERACPWEANADCYLWSDSKYKGNSLSGDSGGPVYATINNLQTVVGIVSGGDVRMTGVGRVFESLSLINDMVKRCRPI